MPTSPRCLTSLLLVEERLLEANFFVRRFKRADPDTAGYFLNAYLSSARSVTFLLQKELAHVEGFQEWWDAQRLILAGDKAARFFLELRNFSQKAGRVSLFGSRKRQGRSAAWTYQFVGKQVHLPDELRSVDVSEACLMHLAKLARIVLACMDSFPFHSCPRMALSPDGVKALGLDAKAIFDDLGLPFVEGDDELAWRFLQREVDPIDIAAIRKIAFWRRRRLRRAPITASDQLSAELLSIMEKQLRSPEASLDLARMAMELLNNDASPPGH
ncbi:hypothetical protein [Stutzerimonas nitrititolerans]|uniref:hypothetical protein n=1 Tax=Stutzerimonas nitrititolerans TaxID=2482751 RepID=UPI0028AA21A2|nr:hypothetical protein [Stutzerimonas nitrititolerans]